MRNRQTSLALVVFSLIGFLFAWSTESFGYTMQTAGISQRVQNYINTMQYSDVAVSHAGFQNCLKAIIHSEEIPSEAEEITSESALERIQPGGTYVIQGHLTLTRVFNVPSNVTIYVDGSIHRDGTFTATNGIHKSENGSDTIFMVDRQKNINIIGINNAKLTGNWSTGASTEPGTTAVYINRSSNVTVKGFDIGFVWEGLVARGSNQHIYFLNNYVHDTRNLDHNVTTLRDGAQFY